MINFLCFDCVFIYCVVVVLGIIIPYSIFYPVASYRWSYHCIAVITT